MNHIAKPLLLTYTAMLVATSALMAKNQAQPVTAQAFTERSDYFMCRKRIIDSLQKRAAPQAIIQKLLVGCRDQFPGTAAFIDCKKNAAQEYKSDSPQMVAAVNDCKAQYKKYSFDPLSPIPIFIDEKEAYFAGAGLNVIRRIELPPKEGAPGATPQTGAPPATGGDVPPILQKPNNFGNFSCDPLVEVFQGKRPPEVLLTGNHPHSFTPIADLPLNKFRKLLKIMPPKGKPTPAQLEMPIKVKMFGEIDYPFSDSNISLFFPTGFCYFENRMGNLFDGIKLYYLVDEMHRLAMPYFGIAFFKQEAHLPVDVIVKKLSTVLGPSFKRIVTGQGIHYFTQAPLQEFDEEGDPSNLCKEPRAHTYLALFREMKQPAKGPQFLIFANIHNLCTFGDILLKKIDK